MTVLEKAQTWFFQLYTRSTPTRFFSMMIYIHRFPARPSDDLSVLGPFGSKVLRAWLCPIFCARWFKTNVYTLDEKCHKYCRLIKLAFNGKECRQRAKWESRLFLTGICVETYRPLIQAQLTQKVRAEQNTFDGIVLVVSACHQNCHWKGFSV